MTETLTFKVHGYEKKPYEKQFYIKKHTAKKKAKPQETRHSKPGPSSHRTTYLSMGRVFDRSPKI